MAGELRKAAQKVAVVCKRSAGGYLFLIGGSKGGDLAGSVTRPALTSLLLPCTILLLGWETTFVHSDTLVHYIPYLFLSLISPDPTLLSACLHPLLPLLRRYLEA